MKKIRVSELQSQESVVVWLTSRKAHVHQKVFFYKFFVRSISPCFSDSRAERVRRKVIKILLEKLSKRKIYGDDVAGLLQGYPM